MKTNKEKWIFTAILAAIDYRSDRDRAFAGLYFGGNIWLFFFGQCLSERKRDTRLPVSGSSDLRAAQAVDPPCRMAYI